MAPLMLALLLSTFAAFEHAAVGDSMLTTVCPSGTTLFVKGGSKSPGTGDSWNNPLIYLQDALEITDSCPGIREIWVATGVYYPDDGNGQTTHGTQSTFRLRNDLGIFGGFVGTEATVAERNWISNTTVLSGDIGNDDIVDGNSIVTFTAGIRGSNAIHVITSEGVNNGTILDGFVITAGSASSSVGGGLYSKNGSPILRNLVFQGNVAVRGAGIFTQYGSPAIFDTKFISNVASQASGGMESRSSTPVLTGTVFYGNKADSGGGFSAILSAVTFVSTTFTTNQGTDGGGGMLSLDSALTITHGVFADNVAAAYGSSGVEILDSTLFMSDVLFYANLGRALGAPRDSQLTLNNVEFMHNQGVGLDVGGSNLELANATFRENRSGGLSLDGAHATIKSTSFENNVGASGGGITIRNSQVTLTDVLVSHNSAGMAGGIYVSNSGFLATNTISMFNVAFIGNTATDRAGGLIIYSDAIVNNHQYELVNVTFCGNKSVNHYGVGALEYRSTADVKNNSVLTITNSIFWNNRAGESGDYVSAPIVHSIANYSPDRTYVGHSLVEWSNGSGPAWNNTVGVDNGSNIDANPLFVNVADPRDAGYEHDDVANLRLLFGSPAVDAGENSAVPENLLYDLGGMPRIQDDKNDGLAIVDLGAYEGTFRSDYYTYLSTITK